MKGKLIIHLCFLIPFVITVLNLQVIITYFVSVTLAQFMAYFNMGLIFLGTSLVFRQHGILSKTSRLWIIFFVIYFVIGIFAGAMKFNNPAGILLSTIPFMYAVGFHYYLSIPENRPIFGKVAIGALITSCLVCIYWDSINFDLDYQGVYIYVVDRAQGVYGDANNMALVTIIAFIFVYKIFNPSKTIFKIFKLSLLAIAAYSLFLTFSNTGFMAFVISLVLINYNFFKGIRIILGIILLPIIYITLLNLNNITANMNLVGQQRDKINNIVNIVSLNFDKVDDSGRGELQERLKIHIYENPILGNGIDFGNSYQAHNTYLAVWADAGIFALVFFLFLLFRYFIKSLQSPPEVRYFVLPLMITLCVFMLSLHSVINQPYIMAIFIYIGYLVDFFFPSKNEDEKILDDSVSVNT